jgi:hypothetical protein
LTCWSIHGLWAIAAAGGQDRNQGASPGATLGTSVRPLPEGVRTIAIDQAKPDEFPGRFVADLGAVFAAPAVVAGERYVTEWLRGQAAGGHVSYDPAADRYHVTDEQAFALADETSPAFVPGAFQLATSTIKDEPRSTEAIRTGDGLGWDR